MRSFLFACLLTACGGGSGGVSPDELPSELGDVTCAKLSECCTTAEFMEQTLGADSEAECRALFSGFGSVLSKALNDSIDKGRVIYDGDRMAACLDAIAATSCTEFAASRSDDFAPGDCEDPFEPQVAAGGECVQDFDCISGFCDGGSTDFEGNLTYGACADRIAIGQACSDSDSCVSDAFCDFSSTTGQPTCEAKLADGSGCTSRDQCTSGACNGTDNGNQQGTCGVNTTCDGQ